MNRTFRSSAALFAVAAIALSSATAFAAKPGGEGEQVVLRLGTLDPEDRPDAPVVKRFEQRVEELTDGGVQVDIEWAAAGAETDFEQRLVGMVQGGDLELGWVGSRAFDVLGVPTLQALQAPFLITDYPLLSAVVTSDLPARMLSGLEELDLVGLGLFPDDLRYPIGYSRPFLSLDDLRGVGFRVPPSNAADALFRALGAEPKHLNGPAIGEARDSGEIEGIELSMDLAPDLGAPYVPGGLTLYPRVNTLFASDRAMRALTPEQQEAIRMAVADALEFALRDLPDQDDAASFCAEGGQVVIAQPADVDAIVAAAEPVYAAMEADPVTRDAIAAIRALKASAPAAPALEPCSNVPAPTPIPTARHEVHPLVGRWETPRLTAEQMTGRLDEAGFTPEEYATVRDWFADGMVYTITIAEDGSWIQEEIKDGGPPVVGWEGTWELVGDDLIKATEQLGLTPSGAGITYRWVLDGDQLRFEIADHPFDRFDEMIQTQIFTTAPFIRVP